MLSTDYAESASGSVLGLTTTALIGSNDKTREAIARVSVIIPCFNAARYIGRTLESVCRQTFGDWECIVVDDGSTDDSARVIETYTGRDGRVLLVQQPNGGVSRARNAGYAASSPDSEYLLFLDADDCLEARMLEVLVSHLDQHVEVCLVYCAFVCIDGADQPLPADDPRVKEILPVRYVPSPVGVRALPAHVAETPFSSIFAAWAGLLPSNSLLSRSVYACTPGWDEVLGQPAEDTDIFLQMALLGRVHFVSQQLVRHRRHASQSTRDRARLDEQNRKLMRKWAELDGVTEHQAAVIRSARWFRETRLLPYLWLKFGADHIRSGNVIEGFKCCLRAARQIGSGTRSLMPHKP